MKVRLGVNIDHVATLRMCRGESYPSIEEAALNCIENGADQITIHCREDRRHIQDHDVTIVRRVTKENGILMNLEMACYDEMIEMAFKEKPDWVCLVPEKREEKTTEGGLNLLDEDQFKNIQKTCERLKSGSSWKPKISLFLEAQEKILNNALLLPIDAVEIHTGEYAKAFIEGENISLYFKQFEWAKKYLKKHHLACHAGHGLTQKSVLPLLERGYFEEYNIGHWIICEAIFKGLSHVVNSLKGQFHAHSKFTGNEGN